jgi:hypothetical protein
MACFFRVAMDPLVSARTPLQVTQAAVNFWPHRLA